MEESKFYRFIKPLIPKPLRPLCLKYQEVLSYLVFGALTTLVNFLVYYPLSRLVHYTVANIAAWLAAVIFAFFVNKAFVFEDERWDGRALLRQGGQFALMRLFSLGAEEGVMLLFVEVWGLNADVTKIVTQVIVVVLNYIFSKFIIFRRK